MMAMTDGVIDEQLVLLLRTITLAKIIVTTKAVYDAAVDNNNDDDDNYQFRTSWIYCVLVSYLLHHHNYQPKTRTKTMREWK
jgi:hypothetical protein